MGKHRINIEKIEDKARRHISFSKRRKGLFKKAAHLGALGCGVAAVVIFSSENTFTFAHPELDSVLDSFLIAGRDRQLALIPHAEAVPAPEEEEEVAGDELEDDQTTAAAMSSADKKHRESGLEIIIKSSSGNYYQIAETRARENPNSRRTIDFLSPSSPPSPEIVIEVRPRDVRRGGKEAGRPVKLSPIGEQ